ncbi:MAG: transketolase [Bacteroidales bacterium]|nr:transketolase [Bacteroidales bacterium]MBQ9172476.1 transketolase [Bacteroidales bacterium]MBQ9711557.1 transketolase [Bacteroidales bacterium]MBR1433965.1 transketolase [Bacteroidales bacterium]MBR6416699.1 transketolase [Bacteroidales bacterium]
MDNQHLKLVSEQNRKRLLEIICSANAGHTGGDLSCLNVLTVLYFHTLNLSKDNLKDENRDRFILSKGHCVEALFVTLEAKGILKKEVLDTLGKFDSPLAGHPTINVPGIEVNSGALGHGLPIGVGMAIAAKMDSKSWKTFVLMGDGEQGEGSIYEAAMAGHQYKLDNLVAIIDRNHLQISGNTEDVMAIDNIHDRWTAFGWDVIQMNGDDIDDIVRTFDSIDYNNGKPHLIVSNTTKGLGVSFMENVAKWHHGVPSAEQYAVAIEDIEKRIAKVKEEMK